MLYSEQHLLFIVRVIDLLRLDDLFLLKDFDGIKPEVMFAPDKVDPSKAARAEGTLKVKVGETVGALCSPLVGKEGLVYGTPLIYALATLAAFAGALRGY